MPTAGSKEQYESRGDSTQGNFGLLPEDTYLFEIIRMENKGTKADPFDNEGKRTYTDIRLYAKPLSYAEDPETPIADEKTGEEINPDKTIQVFFKPERIGFFGGQPSKNRKILASALGVSINGEINYEYEDLVGGKFIGNIVHKRVGDNTYDNLGEDVRPIGNKKERPRPKPRTAIEAARDAFGTDESDDLPF